MKLKHKRSNSLPPVVVEERTVELSDQSVERAYTEDPLQYTYISANCVTD